MAELRTDPATPSAGVALPLRRDLPAGTVTFVFTDIEDSTPLTERLGTDAWQDVLEQHAPIVRAAVMASGGVEVRTEGDSFFIAFPSARGAVTASVEMQRRLHAQTWAHGAKVRVRIGMHTGENAVPGTPESGADYIGNDVVRAARISAAGHGGQVLISSVTRALVGDGLPNGVTLRDLGEQRLKGLQDPERVLQLVIDGVPSDFPPLRTLSGAPNNLPAHATSFIGRERELAEAQELLGHTRLLTLIGPGGTGKSRLSLELAARVLSEYKDGVWLARLAAVTEPALVASQIAHAMGLVVPASATPLQHLIAHLRERRSLLVLDNFEQIVDAAGDVAEILRECPEVKIVVTTRIALRVSGEQEYPVPPLTLPDPGAVPDLSRLARAEAIQLFVERARSPRPDFALTSENVRAVVGIVAHLDGLPLAIELAAARVKIFSPQAILERLSSGLGILQSSARDLPARQQTLRGAIAWSYDLLDPGLRRLFQRISVFRGGVALTQIEQVCGPADEIGREVLDGVSDLVDQSLLRQAAGEEEPRFNVLETIREFGRERLEESGETAEIELRHARAYLALAESMAPELFGPSAKERLDRFEQEQGNLRVALDVCARATCADRESCECAPDAHRADDARVEVSLRLVSALWRFWQMRGHLREGRERAERVLRLPGAERHRDAYMRALEAAGGITYWIGDMDATQVLYERRLALARELGEELAVANAMYDLSFVYTVPNRELEKAQMLLDGALAAFTDRGDADGVSKTKWALANLYAQTRRWEDAAALLPEVIAGFRERGNLFGLSWALNNQGLAYVHLRRYAEARAAFIEGLRIVLGMEDSSGITGFLYDFADLAAAERQDERALRLYGAMEALRRATGAELLKLWSQEGAPWAQNVRELLDRTPAEERERLLAEGAGMSREQAVAYALEA